MSKITLVTINYNDYETTSQFLNRIKNTTVINKIIVVDNKSTDNSFEELKKFENENIKIIQNHVNNGYGSGNNFGIKYAEKNFQTDFYIISNPDIIIEDSEIKKMINSFTNDTAIVTGVMLDEEGRANETSAWRLPKYKDLLTASFYLGKKYMLKLSYGRKFQNAGISEVDVVSGAFFIVDADKILEVNYFDQETFLYHEENILCHKFKEKGYKTKLNGEATFIHIGHSTVKKNRKGKIFSFIHTQNSARIYLKNYLEVSKFKLMIFDIANRQGKLEFWVIETFKDLVGKKR